MYTAACFEQALSGAVGPEWRLCSGACIGCHKLSQSGSLCGKPGWLQKVWRDSHLPRAFLSFHKELFERGTAALCDLLAACVSEMRPAATPRL